MGELPEGFVLDKPSQKKDIDVPEGFVLDGQKTQDESDLNRLISNIPGSAYQFGQDLVTPFMHPLQTADAMSQLFFGLGDKVTGMQSPGVNPEVVDTVGQFMKDRYIDNPYETLINDPVGMGTDILGLLAGGTTLATKLPGKVGRTATLANAAINKFDPVNVAVGVPKYLAKEGSKQFVGKATGVGAGAIERAANSSDDFIRGLRDKSLSQKEITDKGLGLVDDLVEQSQQKYLNDMSKLEQWDAPANITNIQNRFRQKIADFGLEPVFDDGVLTGFKKGRNAKISDGALNEINTLYKEMQEWSKKQTGGIRNSDLDVLKSLVGDFYSENSKTRALVADLRSAVTEELYKSVPGYKKIMGEYGAFIDIRDELQRALSLNDKATVDTSFKKLASTLRSNFEGRAEVIQRLRDAGINPDEVMDLVAGMQMRDFTSKGLMGQMAVGAGVGAASGFGGEATSALRKISSILLFTSPRVTAETLSLLKWPKRQIRRLMNNKKYKQLNQAGRKMLEGKKAISTTGGRAATANLGRYTNLINQLQPQE